MAGHCTASTGHRAVAAPAPLAICTQAGLLKQSSLPPASLAMCHRNKAVAHQREALLSLLHNPLILFLIRP